MCVKNVSEAFSCEELCWKIYWRTKIVGQYHFIIQVARVELILRITGRIRFITSFKCVWNEQCCFCWKMRIEYLREMKISK